MTESLYQLLFVATLEMILATACVGAITAKHRMTVGAPQRQERGSSTFVLVLVPMALALGITIPLSTGLDLMRFLPALAAVIVCALMVPRSGSSVLGESGVRVGWRSSKLESLEEWRLTGDHLRVRMAGEWRAVPVPVADHPPLRERLVKLCPDRESRFTD